MKKAPSPPGLIRDDPPERAATFQKGALAFLAEHDLIATPANYAVAYVHAAGDHPELSGALAKALAGKAAIDSYLLRDLFTNHFTGDRFLDLLQHREDFSKILEEMLVVLAQGSRDATDYHLTLDRNISILKERPNADNLLQIASILVSATVSATRSAKQMSQQLEDTQQQMISLHAELEQARQEAGHDSLTGLANRRTLEHHLHRLIDGKEAPFSLLMLDIDHFKRFNDSYGHILGDSVLRKVAAVINKSIKGMDLAARYGGEEFSVLLPETSIAGAMRVAESIRVAVSGLQLVRRHTLEKLPTITISIGVTEYREGDDLESLFNSADNALYHAKESGRNKVVNGFTAALPQ